MTGAFYNPDPSEPGHAGQAGSERSGGADETRGPAADEQREAGGPSGGPYQPAARSNDEVEPEEAFAASEADPFAGMGGLDQLLSDDLQKIAAERDEYLQALQRLQADFDNFRKRAMRQQTETLERASEGLLKELLPVLDALDLALAHHADTTMPEGAGAGAATGGAASGAPNGRDGDDKAAHSSLVQVGSLLRDTLGREGLERIDAVDVAFDPTMHDAVAHEPADEDSGNGGGTGGSGADGEGDESTEIAGAGQAGDSTGTGHGEAPDHPAHPAQPSVSEVLRAGYRLKGRVIRPAMVKVKG